MASMANRVWDKSHLAKHRFSKGVKAFAFLWILFLQFGCAGHKTAGKTETLPLKKISVDEEVLFSEVNEFTNLGLDNLKDSLWFEASENFDSALTYLSTLEANDSLGPNFAYAIKNYQDSVQNLLLKTIARTNTMGNVVPWTAYFDEELDQLSDSSVHRIDSITHHIDFKKYDLPISVPLDERVVQAIAVFTGPGRGYFSRWLNRRSRFEKIIQAKLAEKKMPRDLLYLAMVESGFNPKAWSKAKASGIWQFISGTGRRYGLADDWWIDPRRDPVQATEAALNYLNDLHEEFQDWNMAMAGYNCGENRVRRLLAQDSSQSYWDMALPKETRYYVPKILAAMIIGHNPEVYGFTIDNPEPPLLFDTVSVFHCLAFSTIARAAETKEAEITALNPALRRWCTPPNRSQYVIYLPSGTRETFIKNYEALDKTKLVNWQHHIVGKSESLAGIAKHFHVSVAAIKAANKLKGQNVKRGQSLLIPVSLENGADLDALSTGSLEGSEEEPSESQAFTYKVKRGDNFYDVSRKTGISVKKIMQLNGLTSHSHLRAGQRLTLRKATRKACCKIEPVAAEEAGSLETQNISSSKKTKNGAFSTYKVMDGETLFSIANKLNVSMSDLSKWNNLKRNQIRSGQKLKVQGLTKVAKDSHAEVTSAEAEPLINTEKKFYVVKSGDSLWDISVKFQSTVEKIKALNAPMPSVLKAGTKIRVK